eukprot:4152655-Pyramimonas_sp.AAC.1
MSASVATRVSSACWNCAPRPAAVGPDATRRSCRARSSAAQTAAALCPKPLRNDQRGFRPLMAAMPETAIAPVTFGRCWRGRRLVVGRTWTLIRHWAAPSTQDPSTPNGSEGPIGGCPLGCR